MRVERERVVKILLLVLFIVFAAIQLVGELVDPVFILAMVKIMPVMVLAVHLVLMGGRKVTTLVLGFLASATGDVLLALEPALPKGSNMFIFGLLAFLLAHIFFIITFARIAKWNVKRIPAAVGVLVFAGLLLSQVLQQAGGLKLPVALYGLFLVSMAISAIFAVNNSVLLGIGGAIFVSSDGSLAWNRFVGQFAGSGFVIMATYYVAQLLLSRGYLYEIGALKSQWGLAPEVVETS
ncbi:MAG: lysoplasmalogenase [Myxococcota bacterium]